MKLNTYQRITLITFTVIFLLDIIRKPSFDDILVEAHGLLFDLILFGIIITKLEQKKKKRSQIQLFENKIDELRFWESQEASFRILNLTKQIRKIDRNIRIDLTNCYLFNVELKKDVSKILDISNSNFSKSCFIKSSFKNSDFSDCTFVDTIFNDVIFTDCNFNNVQISTEDINKIKFNNCSFHKMAISDRIKKNIDNSDYLQVVFTEYSFIKRMIGRRYTYVLEKTKHNNVYN